MGGNNNKRIAKNTIILYGRMIVFLVISLFTSRIVFNTLGVDNFGLYSLVGGIIIFFSFLNNGLSAATKRYITAEIGKGATGRPRYIFNICVHAHIIIAIIILILAETIGIWIVNYILNIPPDSLRAANLVFQVSVIMAIIGIIQSPYMSVIVAHERMNIYAYFTIIDVILKLLVIFLVQVIPGNKLIIYSFLILGSGIITFFVYNSYCRKTFTTCHLQKIKDKPLLKDIFSFMSWSLLGQIAVVSTNQGVSVLVNIFYSVTVNAAMGISSTVTSIVNNFVSNFQIAFNPQIIKQYNNGEYNDLTTLIIRASKISSYLILIFLIPLCFETHNVLHLWLGDYPQYTVPFVMLTLVAIYFEAISAPLWMVIYAQTKIKQYQIVISLVYSLNFILGWAILWLGVLPYNVITIRVFIFMVLLAIRLIYVRKTVIGFNSLRWLREVCLKSLLISLVTFALLFPLNSLLNINELLHIIIISGVSLITMLILIYGIGLDSNEKKAIYTLIIRKLRLNYTF